MHPAFLWTSLTQTTWHTWPHCALNKWLFSATCSKRSPCLIPPSQEPHPLTEAHWSYSIHNVIENSKMYNLLIKVDFNIAKKNLENDWGFIILKYNWTCEYGKQRTWEWSTDHFQEEELLGWQKVHSGFSVRWYRKTQWTFWPTQYIFFPLSI